MNVSDGAENVLDLRLRALSILGVVIALFHIYANTFGAFSTFVQNGLHFGGFALMCFLTYPVAKGAWAEKLPIRILDLSLALLTILCVVFLVVRQDAIYARQLDLTTAEFGAILFVIGVALELTRRTTGWIIPMIIVIALTYAGWWGSYLEGALRFGGLTWETIFFRSIYADEGLFGTIATISSTYVFMFILFGAFLLRSGAGEFIIEMARSVAGRFVGGPGFVAVFASGLTGTISGSAVANTVSTGVITIPLMKRSGFPPHFAGGVEAAASTGGQLMPPIMGAGAFVMASMTQIPYGTIAILSLLPALLYFACVGFFVRIEAKQVHAKVDREPTTPVMTLVREGGLSFFIPIAVLIGMLIYGFTPIYAAGAAILSCVGASWISRDHRMGPKEILEALALGSRNMVMTAILLCTVGLIVNVIATTGLGNTFSLMIATWSGGSILIALVLIALASLVLGMGLPVTAAYIVLGTLAAPALMQLFQVQEVLDMMVAGQLPENARAFFMLLPPEFAGRLDGPMAMGDAKLILGMLPPDAVPMLAEQSLSPAVVTTMLLSAHLIIYWLSQDSNVTPPVCLAAFAAAAVAKSGPMRTGFASWRIAKGLYFVPLLMAYTPLLSGDWLAMLEVSFFAFFGLWALTAAIEGYLEAPLTPLLRGLMLLIGFFLLWPVGLLGHLVALVTFAGFLWFNRANPV